MNKRRLGIIIIIIGLIVILYPKSSELYYSYQQQKILKEWEQSLLNIKSGDKELDEENIEDYADGDIQGTLKIDKIDLKLPILTRATNENLLTSLASIDNTGKPGQIGNYAIAGHRNLTYGRNFNRLDEIEIGDTIDFSNEKKDYKYKVSEKLYVLPHETWVLNGNNIDREITLITCHPMGNPTHRLIIKGKIEK